MTTRDQYIIRLRCPKCGKTGDAEVSEDHHPYMHDIEFHVDSLAEGFKVSNRGLDACDTEFMCAECRETAV
jgi:hypothetical protein